MTMAFGQGNETERLLCAGHRREHFYRAQHRAPMGVKRQFNDIASVHRRRQKQQATVAGNDVQFASHAETILELQYSPRRLGEPESRNASVSVQSGRNTH